MEDHSESLKKKVLSLPYEPGVYIMLDARGEVIYVGKAKKLKNRVSQYFQDSQNHTAKTRKLVSQIADFDFIVAASEYEALMLECSLIKRHMPKYNILLKDDKGFHYIRVDMRERYPRLSFDRATKEDGARWFGPYYTRHAAKSAVEAIEEALRLPTCSKKFPRDIGKERPCLNYHMGRCLAPCAGYLSEEEYRELMEQAVAVLEGRYEAVAGQLEREMQEAAEELRFERAARLRDERNAILQLGVRQNVIAGRFADTDAFGFYGGARSAVVVLRYVDGALMDKETELLAPSVEDSPEEILDAFLPRYYAGRGALPRSILLPFDVESREALERMLSEQAGRRVEIAVPQRGTRAELVRLASRNAREEAERVATRADRGTRVLKLFASAIGFEKPPERIEAFDVSNLAGSDVVASMTVHTGARPDKAAYRRFRIKGFEGQDDYAAMHEVITRRFTHLSEGDERFLPAPDLLLIDGGEEHARVAQQAENALGYDVPVLGMVKDGRHRTRALVTPDGREIALAHDSQLFGFVGRIQEETHRFAIEYNRQLRRRRIYGSELDKIEGVGKARRTALLKQFGSMKKISSASVEELEKAVPRRVAEAVYAHFHTEHDSNGGEQDENNIG